MGEIGSKLIELLDFSYEYQKQFLATLTENERSAVGESGSWAPRDILAHVSFWDIQSAKELVNPAAYEPPDYGDDFNATNEEFREELKDIGWIDIEAMVDQAHHELIAGVRGLEDEQLTDPDRYKWTRSRPLWNRIVFNSFYHPMIHLGELFIERGEVQETNAVQEKAAQLQLALSETDQWRGTVLYNLGCYYAKTGQKELALTNVATGLPLFDYLKELAPQDGDLEILHDDPEFIALLTA